MSRGRATRSTGYLRFAVVTVAAAALLAAGSWLAARRLGGADAARGIAAACAVVAVGSLVGGVPVARARRSGRAVHAALSATVARAATVVVLAAAVAGAGRVSPGPFLVATAIGYLALLPIDAAYAITASRPAGAGQEEETKE